MDFDGFDGEQHIGRIVWSYAASSATNPKINDFVVN